MDSISVGICQLRQGYDFENNLSKAITMVDAAASMKADIVVLPEMFLSPYEPASIKSSFGHVSKALEELKRLSIHLGVYIVAGSMPTGMDSTRCYNRAHVFGQDGQIIYRHDKLHLFDCSPPGGPRVRESEFIMPGDTCGAFDTPWGRASVIICYDIRFSPLIQHLADRGVCLLFVPAAFSLVTGRAHWEMLVRMRALELQGFVIGVQPAYNPELRYIPYGHSTVASPWGDVILDAGEEESLEVVTLDLTEVKSIRQRFPLLDHRRKDLYATCWRREND